MPAKHTEKGKPVHEAEARGIQSLVRGLPDNYRVFSNIDLPSDRRGQTFEHDAIVVAPHAIFTVELKSWGGRITGNRDRWTLQDGAVVQSPIPLVLSKARILKGRFVSRRRDLGSVWVQGLVFLSAADAVAHLTPDFQDYVVNLGGLRRALTDPGWLGPLTPITPAQRRAIEDLLDDGVAPKVQSRLDDYRLVQRLAAEDRPYEAWLAERTSLTRERRVLHAYTLAADSGGERDRLAAHALREATLHGRLSGGRDILRYETYFVTRDDPQRIVLQFEDTTPLQPMSAWAKEQKPGMHARLVVAARIARALAWVHERGLVHRRLSPEAVLVSNEPMPAEVRLCAFELARDVTGALGTITASPLGDPMFRCAAPEVIRTGEATARSDLFSLGATLVELWTGRPLFANADEIVRPFTIPPLLVGDRACPRKIADLTAQLLSVQPSERPLDAATVAGLLEDEVRGLSEPKARVEIAPGAEIRETYELIERLGRGATATTWKARQLQTDHVVVLKIADAEHAHYLQEEGRVLSAVQHPNLVRFHNVEPFEGGNLLVLEHVDGHTATLWAGAGDPLDPAKLLLVATGLFGALGALHQAGWVHRDVKPDNVMLTEGTAVPKLLDLGLAARWPVEGDLAVGSIRYKDPLVYVQSRWTPANDLFSASLVLYEILTGAHPFGGAPPEPGQRPTIVREEFPESHDAALVERLATLFSRALSPDATERPATAAEAIALFEQAITAPVSRRTSAKSQPTARPNDSVPPPALSPDVDLGTAISVLDLSTRAQGALARLGISTIADLLGFDVDRARALPNVGWKTVRELRALSAVVQARWPGQSVGERKPAERFYPALAEDPRPLDELGRDLTPSARDALLERGVLTIGDLAVMPPDALERLPFIGNVRLGRLRAALRRLAGREELPETLEELDTEFRGALGNSAWGALTSVIGLRDGQPRSQIEAAGLLGVTRQRVSQATDLEPLRAEASWGRTLVSVVTETMPPAGFATLQVAAAGLATRLPSSEGKLSPLGYARLAALLLQPDARATEATEIRWVVRPPWTVERIVDLQERLHRMGNWPVGITEASPAQVLRGDAEVRLWDAVPPEIQRALVRWGADKVQLLDALLKLDDTTVQIDRAGGLYTPPVELWAALSALRRRLSSPVVETARLLAEARETYRGLVDPTEPIDVEHAIERAGYRRSGDHWVDASRIDLAEELAAPRVDPTIPTQRVAKGHLPEVVEALASQVDRGGFRVVALPPAAHHTLGPRLSEWLSERLGRERVSLSSLDRLIIEALKNADLWKFVPYLEVRPDADYRMFHAEITAALDDAVRDARPGRVTVLAQPSLLGPLGAMDWLSGFYERARGGKYGLVVLAVPGGIHQDRVRLNEKYNLPYTPDMAAVYLEGEAR